MTHFIYEDAFSRNIGLLSEHEWKRVRRTRVGIAGLGGCGSNHLMVLARMGFERFTIADPDVFELTNLNRQAGASLSTLGQSKCEVMQRMALDINPHIEICTFSEGLTETNLPDFVAQTDVGINAIDFFRIDLYAKYHNCYREQGKYSTVGASPFAFGAALTIIGPGTPSFEEVFAIDPTDEADERLKKFCRRMTPSRFASGYLTSGVNEIKTPLEDTRIASSAAAVYLCAALTAAEILFIVTGRRKPTLAPNILEFDLLAQAFSLHNMGE
jgi:molybdopterin/thiamine biosynthesis adenylyltransferase